MKTSPIFSKEWYATQYKESKMIKATMKKIISFSLWGNNPRYVLNALVNADLALTIYPDWICRYYCSPNVPKGIIEELNKRPNVEIVMMNRDESWNGMFWRFIAASDPEVSVMISRDTDSHLGLREKEAVDEWLSSNKDFHIMRDNRAHGVLILGGMWGARNGIMRNISKMIESYSIKDSNNRINIDQEFLWSHVYPHIKNNVFIHDSVEDRCGGRTKDFPTPRKKPWREDTFKDSDDNDYIGIIKNVPESYTEKYSKLLNTDKIMDSFYKNLDCRIIHANISESYKGTVRSSENYYKRRELLLGTTIPLLENLKLNPSLFDAIMYKDLIFDRDFEGKLFTPNKIIDHRGKSYKVDNPFSNAYELALCMGHMNIWEIYSNIKKHVLILEDDVFIPDEHHANNILKTLESFYDKITDPAILYLQSTNPCIINPKTTLKEYSSEKIINTNAQLTRIKNDHPDWSGTAAYAVNPAGLEKLIERANRVGLRCVDGFIHRAITEGYVDVYIPTYYRTAFLLHPEYS